MVRALMVIMPIAAVLVSAGSTEARPDDQQRIEVEFRRAQEMPAEGFEKRTVAGSGETLYVAKENWRLSREDIAKAKVTQDERGGDAVDISFTKQGQEKMGKLTEGWVGKRVAVLLDGKVIYAPVLKTKITAAALISNLTATDADRVIKALNPR